MAHYNVRDIFGHFVAPRSKRGDVCPHSCCRNRRIHPANLPPTVKPAVLKKLNDRELYEHYEKHADCDRCRAQVEREVERRERVERKGQATGQRNRARAAERREHVDREILQAETATRGNMLNAKGRARGISERSLFTGSEDRALRYASPELKNYWQDHPRPTAASLSSNYQRRREAYAGSNLGREQASKTVRTATGKRMRVTVSARR